LYRLTVASQGALPMIVAMTEPRPRLTNTMGSVQQISVVSDEANPRAAKERGRITPPRFLKSRLRTKSGAKPAAESDADAEDRAVA
jgi:hypothetical protein